MSHATVTVKVTGKRLLAAQGDLDAVLAEMLAPYDETTKDPRFLAFKEDADCDPDPKADGRRGYWHNPNKTWDWWVVGGRWTGFYPLKPGAPVRLGKSGAFGDAPKPGRGDVVRVSDLDFDALAIETRASAEAFFAEWQLLIAGHEFPPFDGPRETAMSIGLLRVEHGHAASTDKQRAIPWLGKVRADDDRRTWHDVAKLIDRDVFLAEFIDCFNPINTYAALDNDGWHAPRKLGWFGRSSGEPGDYVKFSKEFVGRFIKSAAPTDLLVVVDYHI